eukprot:4485460-Amphidinium_carterae.2
MPISNSIQERLKKAITIDRNRRSIPKLDIGVDWENQPPSTVHQTFEFWVMSVQFNVDTWCPQAYTMFVNSLPHPQLEMNMRYGWRCCQRNRLRWNERSSWEPLILFQKAPDTVSAQMRVDLLEAVPRFLREKMTRNGSDSRDHILYDEDIAALGI